MDVSLSSVQQMWMYHFLVYSRCEGDAFLRCKLVAHEIGLCGEGEGVGWGSLV